MAVGTKETYLDKIIRELQHPDISRTYFTAGAILIPWHRYGSWEQYYFYLGLINPIFDLEGLNKSLFSLEDEIRALNNNPGRDWSDGQRKRHSLIVPNFQVYETAATIRTFMEFNYPNPTLLQAMGVANPGHEFQPSKPQTILRLMEFTLYPEPSLALEALKRHRAGNYINRYTAPNPLVRGIVTDKQIEAIKNHQDPFNLPKPSLIERLKSFF